MINKDKIVRVLIYGLGVGEKLLISTNSVYFPKDFFKIKGTDLVMLKGKDFPLISKGEPIQAIFEYKDGTRVRYKTSVDLCTEYQMNFHISEGEILQERRRSFKITVDMDGMSPFFIRGEEMFSFDDPVELHLLNLNLGGVFFESDSPFECGDQVMLNFLDGEMQLLIEILRIQRDDNGNIIGYGCKFLNVTQPQEEKLARFIFDCQHMEIERRRSKEKKN
ncbi:MAG: PilZ domain-containing protein [Ruminococcus sp.]|nr:PilZ domain-containing protein [Ruminococcus sp.]MCM1380980.1 PilZ domain-containing protein [Muribaculaceae bacterium]MCM1479124.1 PilZ domain-containing protein [Muribaculaceae bacterium]